MLLQSVANNFSDEQIQIWILFAKDIFFEYEYEYYSWYLVSRIWIRIIFVKNIHEYIRIIEYIRIFENNQIPGYCYLPVWRLLTRDQNLFETFHTANYVKYLMKNSSFLGFYYNWWIWSVANNIHNPSLLRIRIWILFVINFDCKYEY